jgi:NAD(P)-dependent dehydrogenase (short-subunit alcohol dehydrogenase family)
MDDLRGKTAFVTGAGSGIGLGIARQLARAGVSVAVADIRNDAAEAAAAEIVAAGGRAIPLVLDVSDRADVERAAETAERALGPIHIAANNAGVAMHGVPLEKISAADWDWVIGVNIYGVIHGIQTFVPMMRAHGQGGHIVNTASIGGLQVNPNFLTGAYSMTKYAVVALSEALEQELRGSGIGVSVLCPAAVNTSIHLSERSRPERLGGPTVRPENHFMGDIIKDGWAPDAVGARVVEAILGNEFFIFTHTQPRDWIEKRHRRIQEAFDRAAAFQSPARKDVA